MLRRIGTSGIRSVRVITPLIMLIVVLLYCARIWSGLLRSHSSRWWRSNVERLRWSRYPAMLSIRKDNMLYTWRRIRKVKDVVAILSSMWLYDRLLKRWRRLIHNCWLSRRVKSSRIRCRVRLGTIVASIVPHILVLTRLISSLACFSNLVQ